MTSDSKQPSQNKTSENGHLTDPVTMSVIQHRLESINKEMGYAMLRTSKSPIFAEIHDFSTAICDWEPRLISQVDGVPTHTASSMIATKAVRDTFGDDINDGDVFIINDAYTGGTHLPDVTVIKPIYHSGELVFFTINRAHHLDIGGMTAGGYSPEATEIFQEGLRIPPLRIYKDNKPIDDVVRFITINTRWPELALSDIRSQIGSCIVGERRLMELLDKYGVPLVKQIVTDILKYSEIRMLEEIGKFKKGTFSGESRVDSDGHGNSPEIKVSVTITKENTVICDFEGTSPQVPGPINSPLSNTDQSVYLSLLVVVDPTIPHNSGCYRPITINAEKGSLVNAQSPAPVANCTLDTTCAIIDAMWKALSQATPDTTPAGWSRWDGPSIVGQDPRTNEEYVAYAFNGLGGGGATKGADGWHHVGDPGDLGGLTVPNIESNEADYPQLTNFYELQPDSGGPGKWRGGLGVRYEIVLHDEQPVFVMFGDGIETAPFGIHGGKPGSLNVAWLNKDQENEIKLPAKGVFVGQKNSTYTITSAGGGGWGSPMERDPNLVQDDAKNGYISIESAEKDYGVILDSKDYSIVKLLSPRK